MKRNLLLVIGVLFAVLLIAGCDDENTKIEYCNTTNPTEDLLWLKNKINEMTEYDYFMTAKYNDETVFYNGSCNPLIIYIPIVYNCNGDEIGYQYDLEDKLTNVQLLWKHENSECVFALD